MATTRNKVIGGTVATAAALAVATSYVKPWEGLWLTAKVDTIGTGRPVTYCYGQTSEFGKVKVGTKFTKEQCDAMLTESLKRYDQGIGRCIHVDLPDATRAAVDSFSYNVGISAACRSGVIRKMNEWDIRGGCDALMQWVRAQGRVVQGLINRRKKERALCLAGLEQLKAKPEPVKSWWRK